MPAWCQELEIELPQQVSPAGAPVPDAFFMHRALRLASRGMGDTSPNPMVGAVVVRDGQIAGSGYHARAGLPHAEVVALDQAGALATGSTLYVTLEPCCHWGRTPPCTDAILTAGVAHVVAALPDPDPRMRGRGIAALRGAGVQVDVGCLAAEAAQLNEAFIKSVTTGLPWVTLKLAMSLDGRIPLATSDAPYITGPEARREVHRMRASHDLIMVGSGTVIADDPLLTVRHVQGRDPVRVVLDTAGRIPTSARVLSPALAGGTIVCVGAAACPPARRADLEATGARVSTIPERGRRLDLLACLRSLTSAGYRSVLLEGGPTLAASFLEQGLVDAVRFFYAPVMLFGRGRPPRLQSTTMGTRPDSVRVVEARAVRCGDDLLLSGYVATSRSSWTGSGG